ncbi:aminoglycoside phosphotransferase family protein [Kribbella sp. NPDC020789]
MWKRIPFGAELRAELGTPRRVRRLGSSPRSRVWRADVSGTPVVVKQLVDAPEADERYMRELTALQVAATVHPPVAAKLLATDPASRILVLERLEHGEPRPDWVVDYAVALANLHSATSTAPTAALPAWVGPGDADIDSFLTLAAAVGVVAGDRVRAELEGVVGRLGVGGRALLHGDPCPGNDLHTSDGVRFVDFEQAALGNGLVELAYLRIGFPTCWCSTASEPLAAAEAAYRTTWRERTGTEVEGDLADACTGWLIRGDALVERAERGTVDHLARIPSQDWKWGTATARQRLVHRLGVVSHLTAGSALAQLTTAMRESMLTRWPKLQPLPTRR